MNFLASKESGMTLLSTPNSLTRLSLTAFDTDMTAEAPSKAFLYMMWASGDGDGALCMVNT
jgi:hypothetical protein